MVHLPAGADPEAIRAIARPIHGEQDLEKIGELVATKRLVCIGEASHGTREFYDLRAALTRHLIVKHGFTAVVVEGDWPDCLRADRYVRGQGEDPSALHALDSFERFPRWMWRNEDVAMFLDWLRAYNADQATQRHAGFYGLDLYSLHTSMQAVIHYLEDVDADAATRARERYACFDHVPGDPQQYGLQAHIGIGPKCETEVVAQLVEMQVRKLARSGRTPAGDAWFHAVQQAHVVRNAEAYYRTMFGGRNASWNLRDTHMADTVDMVAEHLGGSSPAKVVIWAHNSHVGDARATEMGDSGQITLGQLLRQRHPGEAALIGFTSHEGTVVASHDWDEPAARMRVRPSLDDSWERLFHDAGLPRFYVTASELAQSLGGSTELLQRAIGVVYRPDTERRSHYLQARLAAELDVVIHVDITRGVEPLDLIDEPDDITQAHELPETYPSGV
ncbi:MAG: erythromycin esterase family protein [Kofleriaceae bacterium]|nr:erythromycin esterase family protein [Kofleriaceae bacterium]